MPQTVAEVFFQYPLSDRGRCNCIGERWGNLELHHFQYPLSDRGRCNHFRPDRAGLARASLSVSSVGSGTLQHIPVPEEPEEV